MATVADGWRPTSELERRLGDAVRNGDQEGYFRLLAGSELVVPVPPDLIDDVLANERRPAWPTQAEDDRTFVLAYTSPTAMRACLGPSYRHYVRLRFTVLAESWPDNNWWLAVDVPAHSVRDVSLPIEGRLPAWFVLQLAQGDARPPVAGHHPAPAASSAPSTPSGPSAFSETPESPVPAATSFSDAFDPAASFDSSASSSLAGPAEPASPTPPVVPAAYPTPPAVPYPTSALSQGYVSPDGPSPSPQPDALGGATAPGQPGGPSDFAATGEASARAQAPVPPNPYVSGEANVPGQPLAPVASPADTQGSSLTPSETSAPGIADAERQRPAGAEASAFADPAAPDGLSAPEQSPASDAPSVPWQDGAHTEPTGAESQSTGYPSTLQGSAGQDSAAMPSAPHVPGHPAVPGEPSAPGEDVSSAGR
ncbi:SseB family protein, partial [Spirillospora sp. NPDC049652]